MTTPPLTLEIVAFDSALGPRGQRPFIAGETVHLALRVQGGRAPYEIQVATGKGDPRLAAASTTLQASSEREISAGLELTFGSEVPGGTYALLIRITDEDGKSSSIAPEAFEVIGSDALVHSPAEPPLQLRIVDVAGRARRTFYQGEAIAIRATLSTPEELAIAIVASDERLFMPKQLYPAGPLNIDLPLRVPRLARPGSYRVDMATADEVASVAISIAGTPFPPSIKPVLTDLIIFGGPKQRIPQTAVLRRGETYLIEAIVGGIKNTGSAKLTLRTRVGKEVGWHDFPAINPADSDATARTLLSAPWTPNVDLARGRHMLELEIEEGGEVSTLYREIVLQ